MASQQQHSKGPLRRSKRLASKKPKAVDNTSQQLKAPKVKTPPKGQKQQQDQSDLRNGKRCRVTYKSTAQACVKEGVILRTTQSSNQRPSDDQHRSPSLIEGTEKSCAENSGISHPLSSPCSTTSNQEDRSRKKQQAAPEENKFESKEDERLDKRQGVESVTKQTKLEPYNPIRYWACHQVWPPEFRQRGFGMEEEQPAKKKQKTSNTHHSKTIAELAKNGISIYPSQQISRESKDLCRSYLTGDLKAVKSSTFDSEWFGKVLARVHSLNEDRVRRDVTPWVTPSAENLFFKGEIDIDWIGEEINAPWVRCATMGSTIPKPDLTFGLLQNAFTDAEITKLENYATPTTPFQFTPEVCFPFLICEVKSGHVGMNAADRQNVHSGAIAVNAIFQLYRQAFGKTEPQRVQALYGKALVFTTSHNHDLVFLYANFALFNAQKPENPLFYRYLIKLFSLSADEGADQEMGYKFTVNVLKKFAKEHRQRIKDAVAHLPETPQRAELTGTAMRTGTSDSNDSGEEEVEQEVEEDEQEMEKDEIRKMARQIKQQQKDSARREKEAKEREGRLQAQLEQQQKVMEQAMEQQQKVMEQAMEQQQKDFARREEGAKEREDMFHARMEKLLEKVLKN